MRFGLLNVGLFLLPVLLVNCNTKQKRNTSVEDSVRVDTILPKVEMQQEKRVYHSSSKHDFDFRNLSRQFNIKLSVQRFIEKDDLHDSCIVKALFTGKQSGTILDSISLTSLLFYSNYFTDPKNCVSYSTSVHVFKQLVDNYAGDMVVADLDFDGRDDVAIVNDMGGNSGPTYSFFIQQPNKKFVLNRYLTVSVSFFPSSFNNRKKTITTLGHAGACCVGKHVFQFDVKKQEWKLIEHVVLGLNTANSKD